MKLGPAFYAVCMVVLLSCKGKEHVQNGDMPTGGPCTYDTSHFTMEILSIVNDSSCILQSKIPADPCRYNVWVRSSNRPGDSLLLSQIAHKDITSDIVDQLKLLTGKKLEGTVSTIETGTCTPEIYQFKDSVLNGWQ
jgi:hypothetical protein